MGQEHSADTARFSEYDRKFSDVEGRLVKLEVNDAMITERISNLINKIDGLTSWMKAIVMLFAGSLLSFFVWYIQQI